MPKRRIPLILLAFCLLACFAIADDADDGYLGVDEYDNSVRLENSDILIVNGGGAAMIDADDTSRLEIWSTTLPLDLTAGGGVYDIHMDDDSFLLFSGGATESIVVQDEATVLLKGGQINYLTSYQLIDDTERITIKCQDGWQWLYDNSVIPTGVTGLWDDGTAFSIDFIDDDWGAFPPTWENINVVIIPEPATLALLGLGGLLIRRRK